ncbi:MAG: hypothetical protein ACM3UZ_01600 [Acidobacteriota bacterium]
MKKALVAISITLVIIVGLMGYWGFIPWFSKALGTDKPVDLEVRPVTSDLAQAVDKMNFLSVQSGNRKLGMVDLTGNEVTCLVNSGYWSTLPVKEVQVRFNQDGTAEASGMIQADQVSSFAASQGLPPEALSQAMQKFNMDRDMPFYTKSRLSVIDNQVGLYVDSLEIGRFPLKGLIDQYQMEINTMGTYTLGQRGYQIKSLSIEGGKLVLNAALPVGSEP